MTTGTEKAKRSVIEKLIDKAAEAERSDDALKFSQAACNAANAMCSLKSVEREE